VVESLQINSKRYVVLDADTGEVFAQRDADQQAAMASLTKIFTAIEAIESAPLDLTIETIDDDVFNPVSSSVMGIAPGQTLTLRDLLFGLMLPSGNDAAYVIARALGAQPGDSSDEAVARFVEPINRRVENMGLVNTHLVNPHGWGVPGHYTSAQDLAVFTMYALRYPFFVELISTEEYQPPGYPVLRNNNRMLYWYSGIIGGKTGIDNDSGYCLMEAARRSGNTMVSVTLDGIPPDDWYDDNRVLLDYAFEEKVKRIESGAPISRQVLSYRDPDAAIVQDIAASGGTVGQPNVADQSAAAPEAETEPDALGESVGSPGMDPAVAGGAIAEAGPAMVSRAAAPAIAGAVGLVVAARAIGAYAEAARRDSAALVQSAETSARTPTGPTERGRWRPRRGIDTAPPRPYAVEDNRRVGDDQDE
jgi:D-alanyl-D-alanine carboxypeptidase